jgi:CDGSH-type Zn-finger protein
MSDVTIRVRNSGPILIEGLESAKIVDASGSVFTLPGRTVIALCRCGQTQNSPFCDGSHNRCGFKSEVVARELPAPLPKV